MGGEHRLRSDDAGNLPGIGDRRDGSELDDNTLEDPFTKGDEHRLPGVEGHARGNGIAESPAPGNRRVDTDLSVFHPRLLRRPERARPAHP